MQKIEKITSFVKKFFREKRLPNYYLTESRIKNPKSEIIFLCPVQKSSFGGVKIIYQHASLLDKILPSDMRALVLHPKNPGFTCHWFKHDTEMKRSLGIAKNDFVVIPEVLAGKHGKLIANLGVKYAIYVQNGYLITKGSVDELKNVYYGASLLISISDDTTECIKLAFPEIDPTLIVRVHYSVDPEKFSAATIKTNTISYMPRKLQKHSSLVIAFLRDALPRHWEIRPIANKTEDETAEILGESKIFLAFSEFEGCPLPPVEAAISGNYVIGYTGEGGKEYFQNPLFSEVKCGDIRSFVKEITQTLKSIDAGEKEGFAEHSRKISQQYSKEVELSDISRLRDQILRLINY